MHVPASFATAFRTPTAFTLLQRLAQALPSLPALSAPTPGLETGALTGDVIRGLLLEMGVGATEADIALASALAQTGLPLTVASLAEAHGDLARAPGASPQAYALAKSLELPTTPATLIALSTTLNAPAQGLPGSQALPERLREWLGLSLDAAAAPASLARLLEDRMRQTGRSTENRVASALKEGASPATVTDARTVLLRLARQSADPLLRAEADALASHLEGQQLLNQASVQAHGGRPDAPLYFAFPLTFGGNFSLAELRFWPQTRPEEDEAGGDPVVPLRVMVRVSPPHLGRIQADLSGWTNGALSCRLGVERAGTQRLLVRHAGTLAEALSGAGWTSCDVCWARQTEWPPLWHGGEALTSPRTCVDRQA